jgi:uncharacterized protein (TIGR02996 family)
VRDLDFEAAIIADTDDVGAYTVYADWLLERGDPRGELITVQLARETAPDDAALAVLRPVRLGRRVSYFAQVASFTVRSRRN